MIDQALANKRHAEDFTKLECLHSVLRQISDAATQAEVAGILLGTRDGARVRVLAFRRMEAKRLPARVGTLSEADREAVARLILGPPAEGELYGLEPVGWFRAQMRRELALSAWELAVLNEFFREPRQIGMVLRPAGFGPPRARFYLRERAGFLMNTYRELVVPATAESPILTVEPHSAPPLPAPAPLEWPPPQPIEEDGEEAPVQPSRWKGWIWRAASLVTATFLVTGYWWISLRQQEQHPAEPRPGLVAGTGDRQSGLTARNPLDPDARTLSGGAVENGLAADVRQTEEDSQFERKIADLTKELEALEQQNSQLEGTLDKNKAKPPEPASQPVTSAPAASTPVSPGAAQSAPKRPEAPLPLRPLRLPNNPVRIATRPAELAAPPLLARELPRTAAPPLPLPQSMTVLPPPTRVPPKIAVALGPRNGDLIWTGRLRRNATIIIDGNRSSSGALTGGLPGRPVHLRVYPGDLADSGILVFTATMQDARRGWDPASPQNGWNRIMYEFDPHNAAGIDVEEMPNPTNGWKRLVLRCRNPRLSVIFVKWSLVE